MNLVYSSHFCTKSAHRYLHWSQVIQPDSLPHIEAARQGQGRAVQRCHKVAGSQLLPCWWRTSIPSPRSQINQATCSSAGHRQQPQLITQHTNCNSTLQVQCQSNVSILTSTASISTVCSASCPFMCLQQIHLQAACPSWHPYINIMTYNI